jgi:hypothetical protein
VQEKVFKPSRHVAPFWQGFEAHSLLSVWHRLPENPGKQTQEKESKPSKQVAPF